MAADYPRKATDDWQRAADDPRRAVDDLPRAAEDSRKAAENSLKAADDPLSNKICIFGLKKLFFLFLMLIAYVSG